MTENEYKEGIRYLTQKLENAQAIINRLQADNERLKTNLNIELENYATEYDNKLKAEAYKEFAEKFVQKADKTKIIYIADTTIQEQETGWYQISIADFDNLLKELVDNNG